MTVAAIASRANVSRATAYRYFTNNEGAVLAATVPAGQPRGIAPGELDGMADGEESIAERAAALVRDTARWAFDHESELRAVLALTLSPGSKQQGLSRQGIMRRGTWIHELTNALPDCVPRPARDRLAAALVPLFGADAIVWTTDVADLDAVPAIELMSWMAKALVTATMTEFCPKSARRSANTKLPSATRYPRS